LNPTCGEHLLVVEDEKNLGSTLVEQLTRSGFQVTWVRTQAESSAILPQKKFQLALLDVGLPDGSGFEVAQQIRKHCPSVALIFLTAWGTPEDRIRGLELGAEDYIVKPFHLKELILRIRNGLKRVQYLESHLVNSSQSFDTSVLIGQARIYFHKFEAERSGVSHSLTHKEAALLRLLIENKGKVVSRDEMLNHAWSEDEYPTPRTVDNFMMRLRRLVELNPEDPQVIKSVRGVGYFLV